MKLKGRDIMEDVVIINDGEALQYKKGPNEGKNYYRAACNKIVFILSEEVGDLLKAGKLASLTLNESTEDVTRTKDDGEGNPVTTTTNEATLSYGGHLTYAALRSIVQNEGEIMQLENSFKVAVATAPVDTVA